MNERVREIKELVPPRDPILRKKLDKFDFSRPSIDPVALAYMLADNVLERNGEGLAANQIGLPYRAFVIKANPMIVCFNPLIVDQSSHFSFREEGCLTYPGLFLDIERNDSIKVRYALPNGQVVTNKFMGMTARVFQHELDHLNGVIFTDHVSRLKLEMAMKKAKKRGFKYSFADFRAVE